jgi:hypothetical protein
MVVDTAQSHQMRDDKPDEPDGPRSQHGRRRGSCSAQVQGEFDCASGDAETGRLQASERQGVQGGAKRYRQCNEQAQQGHGADRYVSVRQVAHQPEQHALHGHSRGQHQHQADQRIQTCGNHHPGE